MPILTEQERCGTVLAGKYLVESILGRGGMGVVFRARHLHTDRMVAIKILRPDLSHDQTLGKRFVREAKAASLLRHPNVVEVLDLGIEDDGTIYQVLELLDGEPLSRLLEFKGSLGIPRTLAILLPLMDALVAAHARGIVHRDLKPDNIFLARAHDGRITPTLLDFGIAKMMDGKQSLATRTGSVMGTPQYMAPEQARGAKEHGPGIDIWAMGVIAFECITGVVPFEADSPTLTLLKILTERAPRLDALDPDVPRPLADAIERALTPDTGARHASMSAFVDALRAAADEAGVELPAPQVSTAAPVTFPPPARSADPEDVTELPVEEVLSLGGASALGDVPSDRATVAAKSSAKAAHVGAATLLGPGPSAPSIEASAAPPIERGAVAAGPSRASAPIDAPDEPRDAKAPRRTARVWVAGALATLCVGAAVAWAWPSGADEVSPSPPHALATPAPPVDEEAPDVEESPPLVEPPPPEPALAADAPPEPPEQTSAEPREPRRRPAREPRARARSDREGDPAPPSPAVRVDVGGERGESRRLPGVVEW